MHLYSWISFGTSAQRRSNRSDWQLARIVRKNNIRDVAAFLEFAKDYDINNDAYLSGLELSDAAAKYTEGGKENVETTAGTAVVAKDNPVDSAK